jgi:LysM repeat protein
MKRTLLYLCLSVALFLVVLSGISTPGRAQAGDPYSLIDAVNNLRAANGLPAYQVNPILMSIAQAHSDYQAAIGQVTHTGPGGTRPKDRAVAAGYGGAGSFFMSENIAGGNDLSVDEVISWWLGDAPHTQTMLGANYREIGAGVAESNGFVYYTIDVASGSGSGNYVPPVPVTPGGPTPLPIYRVLTATPKPDGSVIHVVQSGQTLIGIAEAYGLSVAELKALNNLTKDAIYVGDKLTIHAANTPGPTASPSATTTPTRAATATLRPTRTPTYSSTPQVTGATSQVDPARQDAPPSGSDSVGNILVVAIIVLAVGGVLLMVVGSFMKRSNQK